MQKTGIYKIQSKIKPERIYIGSTIDIQGRWYNHLWNLKKRFHQNMNLQKHYNKHGKNDLIFSIIIECDKKDLMSIEQYFLDVYNPYFNFYKIAGTRLGMIYSEETRKQMSEAREEARELRELNS